MGLYVFAGDHGIVAEGVSAYPMQVTAQMVTNFRAGGAAVNVLARQYGVALEVVDCGVGRPTKNFLREKALGEAELETHLRLGHEMAVRAAEKFTMVGVGEMGIGNTAAASAMTAAMLGLRAVDVTGRGAGIDNDQLALKIRTIDRALERHRIKSSDGRAALLAFGGHEMARMAGFLIGASAVKLPVMLDGFITGASALAACRMDLAARPGLFFSHQSAERGHRFLMDAMAAEPLLDLGLRLGEGTGAVLAMGILEAGWRLYAEMASFESAGVSGKVHA
jgi:nicotinate-nucleotide--dimethylbenzimidazole phosphoribosyltransferase